VQPWPTDGYPYTRKHASGDVRHAADKLPRADRSRDGRGAKQRCECYGNSNSQTHDPEFALLESDSATSID